MGETKDEECDQLPFNEAAIIQIKATHPGMHMGNGNGCRRVLRSNPHILVQHMRTTKWHTETACLAKGKTVFEMLRKVRTAYDESDEYYTSVGDDLMHGECQGKTSSPPSWAMYTITMLREMRKFNPSITIECVEGERTVHHIADMFVDDCDMWTASTRN